MRNECETVKIPVIGYGTWDVRGNQGKEAIKEALSVGYRLIDTAQMYGNEEIVGQAIRESEIARDQIFVTTKISHSCRTAEETRKSIHSSLKKLGLEYVDLLLIHEPYRTYREMYHGLELELENGTAKSIGVSNFNKKQMEALLETAEVMPAINQVESHVYYPQLEFQKTLQETGIRMQSWGPFTEGRRDIFREKVLVEIGEKHGKSSAQIALKFLVQNDICVIPKSIHKNRMEENLNIFDFSLDEKDMQRIKGLDGGHSLFGWYNGQWM